MTNQMPSIEKLILSGANLIQVISYETFRVHAEVNHAAEKLEWNWYVWSRVEGLKKWNWDQGSLQNQGEEQWKELRKAEEILQLFAGEGVKGLDPLPAKSILILEDFHFELNSQEVGERAINAIKRLRNIALQKPAEKALIMLQPYYFLPKDLEKEVRLVEMPYPDVEDIEEILKTVAEKQGSPLTGDISKRVLKAALGMTMSEMEIAFGKAFVEAKQVSEKEIPIIISEKENIIKKSGHLEYFHPRESISDVGGLKNLKEWAERRNKAFGDGAKDFGLDTPKGILLLGIPGTGKSLFAKAIANQWQFPLLRLDMGKIFGGIVGESERNIREALKIAEALAPSILWVDEIEKGLSGIGSSNMSDGGTSARVLGTFLTWMQEKEAPVFVVATANNLTLPPELLRKGRIDEIFFVDLPGPKSRKEIFSIHLNLKKRKPIDFDLDDLVAHSKGFSGAEIQEAVKEGLFVAFDQGRKLETRDIRDALDKTYPLAKVMGDQLDELRKWASGRTVMASEEEFDGVDVNQGDEDRPVLPQEYNNPFIKKKRNQ